MLSDFERWTDRSWGISATKCSKKRKTIANGFMHVKYIYIYVYMNIKETEHKETNS